MDVDLGYFFSFTVCPFSLHLGYLPPVLSLFSGLFFFFQLEIISAVVFLLILLILARAWKSCAGADNGLSLHLPALVPC